MHFQALYKGYVIKNLNKIAHKHVTQNSNKLNDAEQNNYSDYSLIKELTSVDHHFILKNKIFKISKGVLYDILFGFRRTLRLLDIKSFNC